MSQKFLLNFQIALEAVVANKLRSLLTALGIIFGVAAVIAMMAIGTGAQQEILEQIKLVGVNNIVITPVVEQIEEEVEEESLGKQQKAKFSTGLNLLDVEGIKTAIPGVHVVSPEILIETFIIKDGVRRTAKLVGVENDYFSIGSFDLSAGKLFNESQTIKGEPVCVIGSGLASKFFSKETPIGKKIKVGRHWLKVVGVLKERKISAKSIDNLGIRNYNMDVYAPLKTVLIRYKNRALVTESMIKLENRRNGNNNENKGPVNYHQIDRLVVQVDNTNIIGAVAEVASRLLKRRHYDVVDYEIQIPERLLKQQQRTKSIFNIVLLAIAAISLLVGGIGIMNIMLASVLERIKEIGLRMSLGAKQKDIVMQFLCESIMISISGGILGVLLGITLAFIVSQVAEIPTVITFSSILVSFGVAAGVGLIFGITPAKRAASQDPITSLRHE